MRAVGLALAAFTLLAGGGTAARGSGACPGDARLGKVAYVRGSALHLVDLRTCADRVLVRRGASGPVHFLRKGRVLRYGGVWTVPVAGGKPVRVAAETGLRSPDRRHVARIRVEGQRGTPAGSQAIVVDGRAVYTLRGTPDALALLAWSPDSRWLLFYVDPLGSASIAADGVEVQAIEVTGGRPVKITTMLGYPDYLTWCRRRLVATAGGSRLATENKRLIVAAPPAWKTRKLVRTPARAWGSVACAPDSRSLVAQSQPASHDPRFFATRWSLWSLRLDGRRTRLTSPPAGYADESPRWSRDGRSILFVRSRRGIGRFYLRRAGRVLGPLATLGYSLGYYGHHDWWTVADWWQPAR